MMLGATRRSLAALGWRRSAERLASALLRLSRLPHAGQGYQPEPGGRQSGQRIADCRPRGGDSRLTDGEPAC
jgi:hypothetical protein